MGTLRYFSSCRNALEADIAVADLRSEGITAERRSDLAAIAYPNVPNDIYVDSDDWEFAALVRPDLLHPDLLNPDWAENSPITDDDPASERDRTRARWIGAVVVVALAAPAFVSLLRLIT